MNIETMSVAEALARADALLRELKAPATWRKGARLATTARWVKRLHDGGRLSMYRTVAARLDLREK